MDSLPFEWSSSSLLVWQVWTQTMGAIFQENILFWKHHIMWLYPVDFCSWPAIIDLEAPSLDLAPNNLFKINPSWWAMILAPIFSEINPSGKIPPPQIWKHSIIIPIFKSDPANYHSVSFLSSVAKLYTSYLCLKLGEWITSNNNFGWKQIGFRKGSAPQDQYLILAHLVEKYTSPSRDKFYVIFIYLKKAFNTVPRSWLEGKLEPTSIDNRLLWLKKHTSTPLVWRKYAVEKGELMECFHIDREVKQGCLLSGWAQTGFLHFEIRYLSQAPWFEYPIPGPACIET